MNRIFQKKIKIVTKMLLVAKHIKDIEKDCNDGDEEGVASQKKTPLCILSSLSIFIHNLLLHFSLYHCRHNIIIFL